MNSLTFACCLQAILFALLPANVSDGRAVYRYPFGIVTVTFDPRSITRQEMDSWMRLSPSLSSHNDLQVPVDIRRCLPGDRRYTDCKADGELRLRNIDQNIREIEANKRSLETQKVPDDLRPIVTYLSEIQAFALWAAQRRRAFFLTHDVSDLKVPYGHLNSNLRCDEILQKIARPDNEKNLEKLFVVDWYNCALFLELEKIGPYPEKDWQSFLTSHHVKEVVQEEVPED